MKIPEERIASLYTIPFIQVIVGIFLFIALILGFREFVFFLLIVLGIGTGARLWSRISPRCLEWDVSLDKERVFPGEKPTLELRVANARFLPILFKATFFLEGLLTDRTEKDAITTWECGLLWYQRLSFRKELVPKRRGLYRVGPPVLKVGDLFGFYPREKKTDRSLDLIVYPRLVRIKPLELPKREFFGLPGAKSPVEDPVYIYGTRDYQPGSPSRRIHWKASARHNRIQEKLCEPAEQEKILFLLDVQQFAENSAAEDLEKILEVLASFAVKLERQGQALGFVTNSVLAGGGSNVIPIARHPLQAALILETLARITLAYDGDLMNILSRGYDIPWGATGFCFLFRPDKRHRGKKAYLGRRNIPLVSVYAEMPGEGKNDLDHHLLTKQVYSVDSLRGNGGKSDGIGRRPMTSEDAR